MLNAMIPQTATLFLWAMYCRENVLQKERGRDGGDFEKTVKYPRNKSDNNFNGEQLKKQRQVFVPQHWSGPAA